MNPTASNDPPNTVLNFDLFLHDTSLTGDSFEEPTPTKNSTEDSLKRKINVLVLSPANPSKVTDSGFTPEISRDR